MLTFFDSDISTGMRRGAKAPMDFMPPEWVKIADEQNGGLKTPLYQNRRQSSCFSNDGGKTYHDIDDEKREVKTAAHPTNV